MDQQYFESVVRKQIDAIGDGDKQRHYVYQRLRAKVLANAEKSPADGERWNAALPVFDAAVRAVEAGYAALLRQDPPAAAGTATLPPVEQPAPAAGAHDTGAPSPGGGGFVMPDETPGTAGEYFWLKMAAGCGALVGVLDFLKPIIDLQSPSFILASIAVMGLFVLGRVWPSHARMIARLRNGAAAVAVAVVALFGLQSQFPGNAPNGAIAEVLPGLVQLQSSIESLREPLERIGQDTGRIAEATDDIKKSLEAMAEAGDGRLASLAEIERAGYTADVDGLTQAINDDSAARYYFHGAGIGYDAEAARRALVDAPLWGVDQNRAFQRTISHILTLSEAGVIREIRAEMAAVANRVAKDTSLDGLHGFVCPHPPTTENWLYLRLARECRDSLDLKDQMLAVDVHNNGARLYAYMLYREHADRTVTAAEMLEGKVTRGALAFVGTFQVDGERVVLTEDGFTRNYLMGTYVDTTFDPACDRHVRKLCAGKIVFEISGDVTLIRHVSGSQIQSDIVTDIEDDGQWNHSLADLAIYQDSAVRIVGARDGFSALLAWCADADEPNVPVRLIFSRNWPMAQFVSAMASPPRWGANQGREMDRPTELVFEGAGILFQHPSTIRHGPDTIGFSGDADVVAYLRSQRSVLVRNGDRDFERYDLTGISKALDYLMKHSSCGSV